MTGCVDLGQVTQFAKASQDVGKNFPDMAAEAAASCKRANGFINDYNKLDELPCNVYPTLNPTLIKINAALFNYIASIGKLASDDLSKVPGGIDKLAADLKQSDPNMSAANQASASAAGGLAKAITEIWASGYRQRELSKIVKDNDGAVQSVTMFLADYAAGKYLQSVSDEWRYESSYCANMMDAAKQAYKVIVGTSITVTTTEPLAADLMQRKCDADEARISTQKKAIADYKSALKTIGDAHGKLAGEGTWDIKELSSDLGPGTVALGSVAVSINKAF